MQELDSYKSLNEYTFKMTERKEDKASVTFLKLSGANQEMAEKMLHLIWPIINEKTDIAELVCVIPICTNVYAE